MLALGLKVDALQHVLKRFGADFGSEGFSAVFVERIVVFIIRQQLIDRERRQTRFDYYIVFEIKDPLEFFQRHIEQQSDTARK